MRLRLLGVAALAVVLAVAALLVVRFRDSGTNERAQVAAAEPREGESEQVEGARAPGPADFAGELQEVTERVEAFNNAKASGKFGKKVAATTNPATGWVGSQVLNEATDDWEPAVAADPSQPYVYLLTTRYGVDAPGCAKQCPQPFIALTVSADGGATWDDQRAICLCLGTKGEFDPTIEVVPNTGAVYSAFLLGDRHDGFSTVFTKSTDHGAHWSTPVHVYGNVSWTDKPEVTTSSDGKDVYVSWNGPQGGDLYVGVSHDYGATWTQQQLSSDKRYYYAYDARVLSDDRTVVFSESSLVYNGLKNVDDSGGIWHHAIISRDKGATWDNIVVAKVQNGEACVALGCGPDFYTGQTSVVSDAPGHLVFAYEGATITRGPQRVYVARSSDSGRTWTTGAPLSVNGENATGPRLASSGGGNVRMWYMQTTGGDNPDAWNVFYRTSTNGGATWSASVKISDEDGNAAAYVNADGSFDEIYGDYGEIAITSKGKTIATWGEGLSWTGPGGTWFNVQK
jgi:BNR repeat-like domain